VPIKRPRWILANRTAIKEVSIRLFPKVIFLLAALSVMGCKRAEAVAEGCTVPVAPLRQWVTDHAGILNEKDEQQLQDRLAAFEKKTKHQLVVASVKSLAGQRIEDFSLCLANKSAIGRKDANDGLMLLVAPNERKVRIEVGRGLEKALTDAEASSILEEDVIPAFTSGAFKSGITKAVDRMMMEAG
jgi:uncharacterized protein